MKPTWIPSIKKPAIPPCLGVEFLRVSANCSTYLSLASHFPGEQLQFLSVWKISTNFYAIFRFQTKQFIITKSINARVILHLWNRFVMSFVFLFHYYTSFKKVNVQFRTWTGESLQCAPPHGPLNGSGFTVCKTPDPNGTLYLQVPRDVMFIRKGEAPW